MKALLAYTRAFLVIVSTAGHISLLLINRLFNKSSQVGFFWRRSWARWAGALLGVHATVIKNEKFDGPALYISNHRSMVDPVIQARYINAHIIAKNEVSKLPVISQGAKLTGIIFVKRDKLTSRIAARNETERLLLEGKSVLVYAEGTTGTRQTTIDFKPGTFAIAATHNIPIIPVVIEYKQEKDFWLRGGLATQMIRQVGAPSTWAKLSILDPIYGDDARTLCQQTKDLIDAEIIRMQENWSEVFKH
jgi:1-acyl-sn-glycerol-3-phosphate acyltransferase